MIKEIAGDRLILKRSQFTGTMKVSATLDNGGAPVTVWQQIQVIEPTKDAWLQRTPDKEEKPVDNQFYARDDSGEGTLFCRGMLDKPADLIVLRVFIEDRSYVTESQKPASDGSYGFAIKLKPGLFHYRAELATKNGENETTLYKASNLVCGDAWLIQGQSNALATDTREESPPETSDWIRSYGSPDGNAKESPGNLWCNPVWKVRHKEKAELGYWGMELAKRLVESQKVPICIINGAVGGTRIDQHQRKTQTQRISLRSMVARCGGFSRRSSRMASEASCGIKGRMTRVPMARRAAMAGSHTNLTLSIWRQPGNKIIPTCNIITFSKSGRTRAAWEKSVRAICCAKWNEISHGSFHA